MVPEKKSLASLLQNPEGENMSVSAQTDTWAGICRRLSGRGNNWFTLVVNFSPESTNSSCEGQG